MLVFPNAKINLGLHIRNKRIDGYHNLETIFFPIPFYDILEIIPLPEKKVTESSIDFSITGTDLSDLAGNNLCIRAVELLRNRFTFPPLAMHLHKSIPLGAGLGGGSSDGAFTLKLLNNLFHLDLSHDALSELALELGSDCPFFLLNQSCFAQGRGEIIEPVPVDLSGYKIVIINPGLHISTARAFSLLDFPDSKNPERNLKETIQMPVEHWKNELVNDFEEPVFNEFPVLNTIREDLYKAGAVYASMSGSGSTIYGIFKKESNFILNTKASYFVKEFVI